MGNADTRTLAHGAGFGRDVARVGAATALVLLAPLAAMQFTREVNWTALDFGAAAVLLLVAGLACVRAARRLRPGRARLVTVTLLALAFAAVWIELAVGVFFNLGS